MPERPAILSLERLTRRFGDIVAVDDISLAIEDGEFFTIVGPSGSGKSTLLRMLAGLDRPTSGDIRLRGRSVARVPANRRPTAMVFQSLALFDHKTVGENIEFALKMRGVGTVERRARAYELMDLVHLPRSYDERPATVCSGGERQRIALARALASDPDILFFDEPLSAIDYRLRKILEVEMKDLHRRTGKTFVYITHSLEEAMVMSDRIAIMRAGRIVQLDAPEDIYHRPNSRFVAEFMGEVNVFPIAPDGTVAHLGAHAGEGGGYLVLRPEKLRRLAEGSAADVAFEARVANDYMLGSRVQYHLEVGGETLVLEEPGGGARIAPGGFARFGFDLGDCRRVAE